MRKHLDGSDLPNCYRQTGGSGEYCTTALGQFQPGTPIGGRLMARMRSLKPEFWHDQEITRLTRDARLLYMGMWNLADEHSRLQGDPRFIKGQVFPYDDDLTAPVVAALLDELVTAQKAVRYHVRGAVYVFLPKLAKHQRLDADKVPSRLPGPDEAESEPKPESRANTSGKFPDHGADESALSMLQVASGREHVAGSREHDSTTSGADRAALALVEDTPVGANTIVADWLGWVKKRPPAPVIGQIGKLIAAMLAEGIDPDDVRRGLAAWTQKGVHASVLPSVVNEVMNANPRGALGRQQDETDAMFARAAQRLGVTT